MRSGVCFLANEPNEAYWEVFLRNFKPDPLYVLGSNTSRREESSKANVIQSVADLPKDYELVVVAPQQGQRVKGKISLDKFHHPDKAIYLFGPDKKNLDPNLFRERKPDHLLYIPTQASEMHAHVAAAIVFWSLRT